MSEQVEGQVDEGQQTNEEVATKTDEQLPKVSEAEAKALTKGWQTKEDWVASGKDGDEWISANHFNKNGEVFSQMQRLKTSVKNQDQRIADNNEFWKSQLETQKQQLLDQRTEAIEGADVEEVNKLDGKIKDIDEQTAKLGQAIPALSDEDTEAENTYFNALGVGHRPYAQQVAAQFISQGLSGAELVEAVDGKIQEAFGGSVKPKETPTNERREKAAVTDSKKRTTSVDDGKLTVDKLTKADKASIQAMRNISTRYAKKSDAEMLKIIGDSKL